VTLLTHPPRVWNATCPGTFRNLIERTTTSTYPNFLSNILLTLLQPIQIRFSSHMHKRHRIQSPRHLIRRHLTGLHTPYLAPLPQALQPNSQFPGLRFIDEEDVFLSVCVADRGAEDVQMFGGLLAGLITHVSKRSRKKMMLGIRRNGRTYLNHLQRPSLNIPLSLRNTSHIVVDEETLRLNPQYQPISNFTHIRHQLRDRLGKKVIEEIHSFDDNLMRVGRRVRTAPRARRRGTRSGSL
jgi:hypothetical protein